METPNNLGSVPIATIELDDPLKEGSTTYDKILISHKPTLGDMYGISLSEDMSAADIALLLGRISNISTPAAKGITLLDLGKVMEALQPFLPSSKVGE